VVTTVAAFIGDETLLASLKRVVAARDLSISLRAYPKLHPAPAPATVSAPATPACTTPARTIPDTCSRDTHSRRILARAATALVAA
jgi:hypothetical protein